MKPIVDDSTYMRAKKKYNLENYLPPQNEKLLLVGKDVSLLVGVF
jgi:hypothetical protein